MQHITEVFHDSNRAETGNGVALGKPSPPGRYEKAAVNRLKDAADLSHLTGNNYGIVRKVLSKGRYFDSEFAETRIKTRDTHKVVLKDGDKHDVKYGSVRFYVLDHDKDRMYAVVRPLRVHGRGIAGYCNHILHLEDR